MDDFVRGKLTECGLERYIPVFEEQEVSEDNFWSLTNDIIKEMIPKGGPRAQFIQYLEKSKKEQRCSITDEEEPAGVLPDATPSTSAAAAPRTGKRKPDSSDPGPHQKKRQKRQEKLKTVLNIMNKVNKKLPDGDNHKIIAFLRSLLQDLKMNKKEQVGVFGRTGAGKSSLLNAVIGEKELLPTGFGRACTSVLIKVEDNTENPKYVSNVEFISEKEFEDLVQSVEHLFSDSPGRINVDDESKDSDEKMKALFGNNWNDVSYETFKKSEKYLDMTDTIQRPKTLTCDSGSDLSEILSIYTQSNRDSSSPSYWPVVKCVTIKMPNNELLRHVTLVDLPGTGDRNKTRNDMWKETVSSCGTVWVVTGMMRPSDDNETWEILERACSFLGNGGECRNIHFICTQADRYLGEFQPDDVKRDVIKEFKALQEVQNHFPEDCFHVFIVSATKENMTGNEILALDKFLQDLNDPEELAQRFVSDAFAILTLMKGAHSQNDDQKKVVLETLIKKRDEELEKIQKSMNTAHENLASSLTQGVANANERWKTAFDQEIGSITHYKKLWSILRSQGEHINLNTTLTSLLARNIDRQFLMTFPNTGKSGLFYGALRDFSLSPESLIEKNKDVELTLKFLKREEEKMKVNLCENIQQLKKGVYNSLSDTVASEMLNAYTKAKNVKSKGAVEKMKQILRDHIRTNDMFEKAKDEMLKKMGGLKAYVHKTLLEHLDRMIDMSLMTDMTCVPEVEEEFNEVMKYHNEN